MNPLNDFEKVIFGMSDRLTEIRDLLLELRPAKIEAPQPAIKPRRGRPPGKRGEKNDADRANSKST